ncbi:MAG: DUF3551 domain-containing protein [Hyphomicrobiales bacterium]|nr:DUF3551 domain-containing protein [Hyphomicrobiales bacterium]
MALATAAVLAMDMAPVQAQVSSPRNPWCIRDGIGGRGSWDCTYHNQRQCLASASGAGGWCVRNPNYQPRQPKPRPQRY